MNPSSYAVFLIAANNRATPEDTPHVLPIYNQMHEIERQRGLIPGEEWLAG